MASVKRRQEQGDYPTEPAFAVETLENALASLFDDYQKLRDAALATATGPKGDPGVAERAIVVGSVWEHAYHRMRATVVQLTDRDNSVHIQWEDGERRVWPDWQLRAHFTWVSDPEATESATKETT